MLFVICVTFKNLYCIIAAKIKKRIAIYYLYPKESLKR